MTAALLEFASSTDRAVAAAAVVFCAFVAWVTIPPNAEISDNEHAGNWRIDGQSHERSSASLGDQRPQLTQPTNYNARPLLAPDRHPQQNSAAALAEQSDRQKQVPRLSGIIVISDVPYALLSNMGEEDSEIYATGDVIGDWMVYELGATSVQLRDLVTDRHLTLHLVGEDIGTGDDLAGGNSQKQAPSR